jgi:homoserine dehydrogenase
MQTVRAIVTGLGNIGRSLLELLIADPTRLERRYGFRLLVVGVCDSQGVAYAEDGLELAQIVAIKRARGSIRQLAAYRPDWSSVDLAAKADYDLLLEATPTNLTDGQPALDIVRFALQRGIPAVLASKGPLVLAYQELAALSDLADDRRPSSPRPALRFSGAVGGALPTINFGWRDLAGAEITRAELIVNGTTQVILEEIARGADFAAALAEAQRQGIVEPDPSLDVDGWDAANKLVIFANAVLGQPTRLSDLDVKGVREVTTAEAAAAWAAGGRISVVGSAERQADGSYRLAVGPQLLPADHPLARLTGGESGFVIYSDSAGRSAISSLEDGPVGTCQAMLRDAIEVVQAKA